MSRRGKDDGFHPHPGDPWSPGWTSDEEPAAEAETPAVEEELASAPEPVPGLETGALEAAVEGAAAEAEEVVAAGDLPAEEVPAEEVPAGEADDWTEILGARPEAPGPSPVVPEGSGESASQTPSDWAQDRLPLEAAPGEPEPAPEPEHLPPPWSPEEAEAEAELAAVAPPEPELVEAGVDHLPPSWGPEDAEAVPPVGVTEPAAGAETEAAEVE
ncbi:MAG TPA: hypothetical protein VMX37_07625, partial [Acidimicrobiia bacterium]|nr:hypothetical protein [Acidimicrobiia bacterium]